MRQLVLAGLLAVSVSAQTATIGVFTHSDDVGAPPLKGSATFDAASGEYTVTGSGADIWDRADEFHYLWREMSGNFVVAATTRFVTGGNPHRKASIMLRESLDSGAPFLHLAIHGDGMPSLQFRSTKGDTVQTVDFPIEGPGVWTLKLQRQGSAITVWTAKDGGALVERGGTQTTLGNPVMVGLAVASHTRDAVHTVVFSHVSVEPIPAPATSRP
jgi:hypothetical protein